MAAYIDLHDAAGDATLLKKATVAVEIAALAVIDEAPATADHAARMTWAVEALENPRAEAVWFLRALIADNEAANISVILGADDSLVQTKVTAMVSARAGVI